MVKSTVSPRKRIQFVEYPEVLSEPVKGHWRSHAVEAFELFDPAANVPKVRLFCQLLTQRLSYSKRTVPLPFIHSRRSKDLPRYLQQSQTFGVGILLRSFKKDDAVLQKCVQTVANKELQVKMSLLPSWLFP